MAEVEDWQQRGEPGKGSVERTEGLSRTQQVDSATREEPQGQRGRGMWPVDCFLPSLLELSPDFPSLMFPPPFLGHYPFYPVTTIKGAFSPHKTGTAFPLPTHYLDEPKMLSGNLRSQYKFVVDLF